MHPFRGFVPDRQTAIEVARPIYKSLFGASYLAKLEPLAAKKYLGRWVIYGSMASRKSDELVEPYHMAIDAWSGRIVTLSYMPPGGGRSVEEILKKIPPDGPIPPKSKAKR